MRFITNVQEYVDLCLLFGHTHCFKMTTSGLKMMNFGSQFHEVTAVCLDYCVTFQCFIVRRYMFHWPGMYENQLPMMADKHPVLRIYIEMGVFQ